MTSAPDLDPLKHLSTSLSNMVAAWAASIVSVHSHRALSSGFVWKPGLIVTADEALAEEGEVVVTFAGGKRVAATVAGRDATTDVALLRAETGDLPAISVSGAAPAAGSLAVAIGSQNGFPLAALGETAV